MKFVKVRQWDYEIDGLHTASMLTNLEAQKFQVISYLRQHSTAYIHTLNVQDPKIVKVKEKNSIIIQIPKSPL